VYLERTAVFAQQSFTLGGALTRNDVAAKLDGEGIECTLNGLYLGNRESARRQSHVDVDHAKPHCASHEITGDARRHREGCSTQDLRAAGRAEDRREADQPSPAALG